ncbi:cytochrome C oxidase subunit IV, partial [Paenibacillus riograndensis]
MATEQHSASSGAVKHRHRQAGPQPHIVVFAFSCFLTLLAFSAVAACGVHA